jgi:hypothetical protein
MGGLPGQEHGVDGRHGEYGNGAKITQRRRERGDSRRTTEEERCLAQRAQRAQRSARRGGRLAAAENCVELMREYSVDSYSESIDMYELVFE